MRFLNALPGALIALAGCAIIVNGVRAIAPDEHRTSFKLLMLGVFVFSFGIVLGTVAVLAPKYGRKAGRSYTFDNDSPMAKVIALSLLGLMLEFGLFLWTAH